MAVEGTYEIISKTPFGDQKSTLTLKLDGETLAGSVVDDKNDIEFSGGKTNGNDFEFVTKLGSPMGKMKATFKGSVDGDNISGNIKVLMGTASFTGKRV